MWCLCIECKYLERTLIWNRYIYQAIDIWFIREKSILNSLPMLVSWSGPLLKNFLNFPEMPQFNFTVMETKLNIEVPYDFLFPVAVFVKCKYVVFGTAHSQIGLLVSCCTSRLSLIPLSAYTVSAGCLHQRRRFTKTWL